MPGHVPDLFQLRIVGLEAAAFRERVTGEIELQPLDRERLVGRSDLNADEPCGPEPERLPGLGVRTAGKEQVVGVVQLHLAPGEVVAATLPVVALQGLGVDELDLGARAAGDGQRRVAGKELAGVDSALNLAVSGNGEFVVAVRSDQFSHVVGQRPVQHVFGIEWFLDQMGNLPWRQAPFVPRVPALVAPAGPGHHLHGRPSAVVEVDPLPTPGVLRAVEALLRIDGIEAAFVRQLIIERRVGLIHRNAPLLAGVKTDELAAGLHAALNHEGAVTAVNLAYGTVDTVADDLDGQNVLARDQAVRQVVGFEIVILEVALGRAATYEPAVEIEPVAAVGRHVKHQLRLARVAHLERPAEIANAVTRIAELSAPDPWSVPDHVAKFIQISHGGLLLEAARRRHGTRCVDAQHRQSKSDRV